MLRQDLISLLNSRDLLIFVGSGASASADLPTWEDLANRVTSTLDDRESKAFTDRKVVARAAEQGDWPRVFTELEAVVGRDRLEAAVCQQLRATDNLGRIHPLIADWPVRAYITSNYDSLLERALGDLGRGTWVPVGNSPGEIRKMSRNVHGVVWHIHGACDLPPGRSSMVITQEDYDLPYLAGSLLERQITGLLSQARVLFVGFGFSDPDFIRLLRLVAKLTDPLRPAFAFLGADSTIDKEAESAEYLAKYNLEVILYDSTDSDHHKLNDILSLYSTFVARRSLAFGQQALVVSGPSIESTGLRIYNELALRQGFELERDLFKTLAESWVLAQLADRKLTRAQLENRLEAAENLLGDAPNRADPRSQIDIAFESLSTRGLIDVSGSSLVSLTEAGSDLVTAHVGGAELLHERFILALRERARAAGDHVNADMARRVADAAADFFSTSLETRVLGMALTVTAGDVDRQRRNVVQMLQTLPSSMERLDSIEEAVVLSEVVQGVFSDPQPAEASFLGSSIQAEFGHHLLGLDQETLVERVRLFQGTAFIVDSNILIPYLAERSQGHDLAHLLLTGLLEHGCQVITTPKLVAEVVEHINWAIHNLDAGAEPGLRQFAALTGRAEYRANKFLGGYIAGLARGTGSPTLRSYLETIECLQTGATTATRTQITNRLLRDGIVVVDLPELFPDGSILSARDEFVEQIRDRRRRAGTLTHRRQVEAEAEVLLIVDGIRSGSFQELLPCDQPSAYFISTSRVIDGLTPGAVPVTITASATSLWMATVTPSVSEDLHSGLTSMLLSELEESGAELVNKRELALAFAPLIDESRSQLDEALDRYDVLAGTAYGSDPQLAFKDLDATQLPTAVNALVRQATDALDEKSSAARAAQHEADLSTKERGKYESLKAKEEEREKKRKKELARRQSSKGRRGRKKRRR